MEALKASFTTQFKITLTGLLTLGSQLTFAQEDWSAPGEIEDAQVIIEKDRKIELPPAGRPFEKVPPLYIEPRREAQDYNFNEYSYQGPAYIPMIAARPVTTSKREEQYNHFIKLGYGNFNSPLGELSLNTVKNKLSAGVNFSHLSFGRGPVDKGNSAASDNHGSLYANLTHENNRLSLDLDFSSVKRYHYGYSDLSPGPGFRPTKQLYNNFGAKLGLENINDQSPVSYNLTAGFYTLEDNFDARENGFQGILHLRAPVSDDISIITKFDALLTRYEDSTSLNRNLLKVLSGVAYQVGRLHLTGAARIIFTNDTLSNSTDFKIYPHAIANFKINSSWELEGGFLGDLEAVTLRSISRENPFINSDLNLAHSNKEIEFYGLVRGNIAGALGLSGGLSFSSYENLYFYTDGLRFNLAYDTNGTDVLNLFGELSYSYENRVNIKTRIDFYNYNTKLLTDAWHRPGGKVTLNANYRFSDRIFLGSTLTALSSIKTFNPFTDTREDLDAFIDLGFNFDYKFSDNLYAFLQLNNLLSNEYERYLNYPNRSFMLHAGITYSF